MMTAFQARVMARRRLLAGGRSKLFHHQGPLPLPLPPPCRRCFSSSDHRGGVDVDADADDARRPRPSPPRLRRSVHFVPADSERFLSRALSLGADTIVLDLEDSVRDKGRGREMLRSFLRDSIVGKGVGGGAGDGGCTSEVLVRINPLSSSVDDNMWREDIEAGFHGADGFVVPKVESRDELVILDEVLTEMERRAAAMNSGGGRSTTAPWGRKPKVLLPIATETPAAVLNIADIARGPRVCAITWGCEDLSAEMGSFATRDADGKYLDVFRHCRSMCLLAARAAGVQAIDGIYQDVRDAAGFEGEAREARVMGFDGKLTLHPDQISGAHGAFEPTESELEEARGVVEMWDSDRDARGSLERNGKMIDVPHYVRARKVIARSSTRTSSDGGDARNREGDDSSAKDAPTGTSSSEVKNAKHSPSGDEGSDEVFPRVHMGKYFEDLAPGLKIMHFLTRTVTESDNVFFTCLTLNPAPIHLDHELSRETADALQSGSSSGVPPGGGMPLFNSMFTLALLVGMSVPEVTHGTTVANLGFSEVKFPMPVFPGDTLRAETLVVERRESRSRPNQGIVTLRHTLYNQRGEVVCVATRQALMKKRP